MKIDQTNQASETAKYYNKRNFILEITDAYLSHVIGETICIADKTYTVIAVACDPIALITKYDLSEN